jgi:hypothetical protein
LFSPYFLTILKNGNKKIAAPAANLHIAGGNIFVGVNTSINAHPISTGTPKIQRQ